MRLTDDQIMEQFKFPDDLNWRASIVATVRRCLALAALPDEQKPYEDVERRGFEVSQPGELPR